MKNYIIIGMLGGMSVGMSSCGDFLEVESLNEIVLEKFWNEEADVENVVMGCYSAMQAQTVIDRMMAWGEFRSDNIIAGLNTENDASLANLLKENINANNDFCNWKDFYDVINRCNTVLHYAPVVAEKDPNYTETELRATQAEVSALRDLCYFYLIRAFQNVPFTTEAFLDDTQEMALPATSFNEILNRLIADLESVRPYAVKTYPTSNQYAQQGRITQNAIDAMLCEMYLWNQDYANAVKYADFVIDAMTEKWQKTLDKQGGTVQDYNKMVDGYPLVGDMLSGVYGNSYSDIFGIGCSRESIFELVFMDDDTYPSNGAVNVRYGNATTFPGQVKPADFISQDVANESYSVFLNKHDTRYYTFMQEASSSVYGINKYTCPQALVLLSSSKISTTYFTAYTDGLCRANWILYRLSDVMLLKAEALVQMVNVGEDGTLDAGSEQRLKDALAIVNTVNKRSSCASTYTEISYDAYSSKSLMENLVFEERQRELLFEGKRWFDLLRRSMRDGNTNYLVSTVLRKGSDNASIIRSKLARMEALFWPYHEDELKVNANLTQNPAYASGTNKR